MDEYLLNLVHLQKPLGFLCLLVYKKVAGLEISYACHRSSHNYWLMLKGRQKKWDFQWKCLIDCLI